MTCEDNDWITDAPCTHDATCEMTSNVGAFRGPKKLCTHHRNVFENMLKRFYPGAEVTFTPITTTHEQ